MSVQIWVLTVPRLASPRFLDFPIHVYVLPDTSCSAHAGRGENRCAPPILVQDVACRMYACIPLLCSDIADAKFNELFVHAFTQS